MKTIIAIAVSLLLVVASALLLSYLKKNDKDNSFLKIIGWTSMTIGFILIIVSICVSIFMAMHRHHKGHHGKNGRNHHSECQHGKKHGLRGKEKCGKSCGSECKHGGKSMEGTMEIELMEENDKTGKTIKKEMVIINGDTVQNDIEIQ